MQINNIQINLSTSEELFRRCAAMMSQSEPWTILEMNYDYCLKSFEGSCKEVYIATYNNEIAGFAILQVCGSFKGYIQTLFVNKDMRGMGIGKILLAFCEKRILSISPNIFICVSSFNNGAIKLYEEFGFSHVGILPDFVRKGFDEILLRKTVGAIGGYIPANTNGAA